MVAKYLTDSGLEVEGIETIESVKGGLKGIVIGEVMSKDKHPNADKLNITSVNVGQEKQSTDYMWRPKCQCWSKGSCCYCWQCYLHNKRFI